jgi:hypothetical protein
MDVYKHCNISNNIWIIEYFRKIIFKLVTKYYEPIYSMIILMKLYFITIFEGRFL